jgi:hypothetical protein
LLTGWHWWEIERVNEQLVVFPVPVFELLKTIS